MASSVLIVAGSGRSGTSLFSGLVHRLGMHVPQPEVSANRTNPRGFAEPQWAVDFDRRMLGVCGVKLSDARPEAWERAAQVARRAKPRDELRAWLAEQLAISDRVVIKDPHLAWLMDLYQGVTEELSARFTVATMVRHPIETTKSRQLAYGDSNTSAARLAGWLNVMLHIERRTRELPRAFAQYDEVLSNWQATMEQADRQLGLGLVSGATPEQLRHAGQLVDPQLRRAVGSWEELGVPLRLQELAEDTWQALSRLTGGSHAGGGEVLTDLDQLRERYVILYDESRAITRSSIVAARFEERRKARSSTQSPTPPPRAEPGRSLPQVERLVRRVRRRSRSAVTKASRRARNSVEHRGDDHIYLLTFNLSGYGGVARMVATMANRLAARHTVEIISLYRNSAAPQFRLDPRVRVRYLVDRRVSPSKPRRGGVAHPRDNPRRDAAERGLDAEPSVISPGRRAFSALTDLRLQETLRSLPRGTIIADRPTLQAAAAIFAGRRMVLLAPQHSSFDHRTPGDRRLIKQHSAALDAVVTLNPDDEKAYREHVGSRTRVVTIPNPVEAPAVLAAPEKSATIIAVGSLGRNKGFHRLIQAFAPLSEDHPDWRLHIYGRGAGRSALQAVIDEHDLNGSVRLMGFHRNLGEVYSKAALLAVSSRHESFGLALVEAMSAGLPVVSYDTASGPRHLISSGENGLLVPGEDTAAYTAALRRLIEDAGLRERMGRHASTSVRKYQADAAVETWERLIAQSRAGRRRAALRSRWVRTDVGRD